MKFQTLVLERDRKAEKENYGIFNIGRNCTKMGYIIKACNYPM